MRNNHENQTIKDMRWVSNCTGVVYDFQVEQLKRLSNLVFSPETVVISIVTDSWLVIDDVPSQEGRRFQTDKFVAMVQYLLGDNWKVQIYYGRNTGQDTAAHSEPRRAKRARAVSKQSRRKRKSGSKNKR